MTDSERVYLGTANVNRQWVQNVQKTPNVKLRIGGETFDGTTRFITDRSAHERAQKKMQKKYWLYRPIFIVVRILIATGLMKDTTGSFEVTLSNG